MDPESLADRFREFRETSGYTQKQLAKLIGKSHVTVQSYEKGTSFPNADTILKMCETYKVDPNTLLGWYIDHPREESTSAPQGCSQLMSAYEELSEEGREVAVNVVSGLTATYPQGLDTDDVGEETA